MNTYSVKINGSHITTVYGDDEKDARRKAYCQLDRPGRKGILMRWLDGGSKVELKK